MRLPNGYGSITKLSGKRRNPYMARITIGVDEDTGTLVRKVLGYYPKRADAIAALAEYNRDPYDLSAHAYTFAEVYEMWAEPYYRDLSTSAIGNHRAAYTACGPLYDMAFRDIRLLHLQRMVDECGKSYNTKQRMKNLIGLLYEFAVRHEITEKDYSSFIEIGKPAEVQNPHTVFTPDEIDQLWAAVGNHPLADTALILIYTGMRAGELVTIRKADIHLEERYMVGGIKTEAGKNRLIPINKKILPLIQTRYQTAEEYLIEPVVTSNTFQKQFQKLMAALGMEHRSHDGRHTFASLMDTAGANDKCIKTIMGHAGGDLTSKVYIHKALPELLENIDLI